MVKGQGAMGLLAVRVVVGLAFVQHGWPLFQHAFTWMGPAGRVPPALQALAAGAEFLGGFGLILGLLTPLAAVGLICTMVTAIVMVHLPHGDPFVGHGGRSFELAAVYLCVMLLLLELGPGNLSLDALLFRKRKQ